MPGNVIPLSPLSSADCPARPSLSFTPSADLPGLAASMLFVNWF